MNNQASHPHEDGHWDVEHIRKLLHERDALAAQLAEIRLHLGTLTPGGSHTCITCAAHAKVILEDLEPRIAVLEAALREGLQIFRAMEKPPGVDNSRTQAWRQQAHGLLHPNDCPVSENKGNDHG